MSVKVYNSGNNNNAQSVDFRRANRTVLTTSTGSTIVVQIDSNDSASPAGFGNRNNVANMRIFESTDQATFTQRVTFTFGTIPDIPYSFSAALFTDNSIGIVWLDTTGHMCFRKVTYGTWALGAEITVGTQGGANEWASADIAISDNDCIVIAALGKLDSNSPRTYIYASPAGQTVFDQTSYFEQYTSGVRLKDGFCSVAFLPGAVPGLADATVRRFFIATSCVGTGGGDNGVKVQHCAIKTDAISTVVAGTYTTLAGKDIGGIFDNENALEGNSFWTYLTPRKCFLFGVGDEMILAISRIVGTGKPKMFVVKWRFDEDISSGLKYTTAVPQNSANSGFSGIYSTNGYTCTYANDTVVFHYSSLVGDYFYSQVIDYYARFTREPDAVDFHGHFKWNNAAEVDPSTGIQGGGGSNLHLAQHNMVYYRVITDLKCEMWYQYAKPHRGPAQFTPGEGVTVTTSLPPLTADADLDLKYPQSPIVVVWQFAKDAGFTTEVVTYEQPWSKNQSVYNTHTAGTVVKITDVLPAELSLYQGDWFVRAAVKDAFGVIGEWGVASNLYNAFVISHPPAMTDLAPNSDQLLVYGTGKVTFSWKYTDPSPTDYQTAFQVVAERVSDGTVAYDSGKVVSGNQLHVGTIPAAYKDTNLRWKTRAWDSDDVVGLYSSYQNFMIADPPSVAINTPASNSTVVSGIPTVVYTPTAGGTRTIVSERVQITKGATTIYDSEVQTIAAASGQQVTHKGPSAVLENHQSYSVKVTVTDNLGMTGRSASIPFVTEWVAPPSASGVAVSSEDYNTENEGAVSVTWDDLNRDDDFTSWIVYRRENLIDPNTQKILEKGVWKELARVFEPASTYEYLDLFAPSGYLVQYRVGQLVNRFGDEVISEDNITNLVTNPSMEATSGTVEVARNLVTNPGMEATSGTVEVARNLLPNPSFELNFTGWTVGTNVTGVIDTGLSDVGDSSAGITAPVNVPNNAAFLTLNQPIPATAGEVFSGSGRVRRRDAEAPQEVRILLLAYGASGYIGPFGSVNVSTIGGEFNTATIEGAVTPQGTTEVRFAWYPNTPGHPWLAGGLLNVDACIFVKSATLPDYFDGDTPDDETFTYSWVGTPHESASIKTARTLADWTMYQAGSGGALWQEGADQATLRCGSDDTYAKIPVAWTGDDTILLDYLVCDADTIVHFYPQGLGGVRVSVPLVAGVPVSLREHYPGTVVDTDHLDLYVGWAFADPAPGALLTFTNVLVVKGNYTGEYFDGDTDDDETFTYSWVGIPGVSESIKTARGLSGWLPNGDGKLWQDGLGKITLQRGESYGYAYTACDWFNESVTILIDEVVADRDTYIYAYPSTGGVRTQVDLQAGVPQQVRLFYQNSGDNPNLYIGWPAADTQPGALITFDRVLVVKGNYTGPYFDGDSPNAVWDGVPHASTSRVLTEYSNTVEAQLQSDGYWLVEPEGPEANADAFKLSIITGDDYTDEYEEAEYQIIGRGRHVDRGDRLGWKGTLTAQIRDSNGSSARQKKMRLEEIKRENRDLFLRTPFGDVLPVYVGNLGISRIAGVGLSEFVDVTIPYSEISP